MGRSIVGHVGALVGIGILFLACGSSKTNGDGDGNGNQGGGGAAGDSCAPGTKRCDGQVVVVCGSDGVTETVEIACAQGLRCVEAGVSAQCDTRACTPGEALCRGNFASTCTADGAGPAPGGTDCGASGQLCAQGKCAVVECDGGELLCSNGDLYRCANDGKAITLVQDCVGNAACDTDLGKCLPRVCTPNEGSCVGTLAKVCNEFGSDWLPDSVVDCADDELKCFAGKCTDQICEPAHSYCREDNVVQCSLDGMDYTPSKQCNHDLEHCEESSGGFAFCYKDVCSPGKLGCDKNSVKVCNDQGYFPIEGESCGDGWCVDGECIEKNCEAGSYFCQDSDIYFCNYEAPPDIYTLCEGASVCRSAGATSSPDSPFGIFCGELSCTPGETVCLKNQVGKCAADGESLMQVTTDCANDSKVCTAEAACAASATDVLGVDETLQPLYSETFTGDLIEVSSARTLTQLKAYLLFPSARQLRWVIYEQTGNKLVAQVDKVANVATSTGYVASPAFSFQLQVGKRYMLGLAISGGDVASYYDTVPYESHVSFGLLLGQFSNGYASQYDYLDNFNHEALLHLEVTTTP